MNAIELLSRAAVEVPTLTDEVPNLAALPWKIKGNKATVHVGELGKMGLVPHPDKPGKQILVVVPAPPILPLVERLHAAGWKRTGHIGDGPWWDVSVYLKRDGAELRITGMELLDDHPDKTGAIPFFADPPPPLSRKKSFKADYEAWERKCHNDEW